jgi:hypothetical protein
MSRICPKYERNSTNRIKGIIAQYINTQLGVQFANAKIAFTGFN